MRRRIPLSLAALATLGWAGIAQSQSPATAPAGADAIYVNANIYTLDADRPRAEALAVRGDRIIAAGAAADVLRHAGPATRIENLGGATVLPGLIDAHGHIASLGSFGLGRIDLSREPTFEAIVATIADRVRNTEPGQTIIGGRWDHESWPDRKLPTHAGLSAVSPNNPVWLRRVDGHAGLANEAAMKLAGVSRESANPPGGEIIRDAVGEPSGVFIDNAMSLIESKLNVPPLDPAALVLKAQEMCLAVGLTGVHDAGVSAGEVDVYRMLAESGSLKLRIYAMVHGRIAQDYFKRNSLFTSPHLTVRSAKLYADGAMGSRGAWLLAPYADRPTDADGRPYTGLAVMDPRFIQQVAEDGLRRGYQVCTHAIGDRGNRETLNAYARALQAVPTQNHRFRVEHAQLLSQEDIPRLAATGVIASMQPTHCTSDMRWVEARVGGERARGAYAWASLLRSGAVIAGGSDFPVESHNPFLGIYAAVTRQNAEGRPAGGWRPEERMTREEALRSVTLGAAYAAFEETQKGSLAAGKLADFVVIDRDAMTCEPRDILGTRVLRTVIGGQTVYRAP
jgi:hypothetical protein